MVLPRAISTLARFALFHPKQRKEDLEAHALGLELGLRVDASGLLRFGLLAGLLERLAVRLVVGIQFFIESDRSLHEISLVLREGVEGVGRDGVVETGLLRA